MSGIHDIRLPDDIEIGATGGPTFKTDVVGISSGAEQRNEGWQQSRLRWTISWGTQSPEDYDTVLQFFHARRGRLFGFLFKDWSDYQATEEAVGTGDGVQRVFHLKKIYGDVENFTTRYITRPDWDSVVIFVGGIANNDWTPGDKGTIVWGIGDEPTGAITWTGTYTAPVRFDSDEFKLTLSALANGEINAIDIYEIREDPNTAPIDVGFDNVTDTLPENTSTAARVLLADIVAIDDGLGNNVYALSGADAASFEIDATVTPPKLYLKAGVVLNFEADTSYTVTVSVQDQFLSDAAVSSVFTLNVSDVNEPPVITFTSATHSLALGTSTASPIVLATIVVTDDALGTNVLSLSGPDAADFDISGSNLRLKAGASTSPARIALVNVDANDAAIAGSPDATTQFRLAIGVVATVTDYDTPGDFTQSVAVYNTLTIETWTPGAGSHGYSPGSTVAPAAAGITWVQNDQTLTALNRWRVAPFVPPNPVDAVTPSSLAGTAKMDSFGIGPALDATNTGGLGGLGYGPLRSAYPGRNLPSGKGGDTVLGATVVPGGAAQTLTTPDDPGSTIVATVDGINGVAPGSGAGGGIYKETINVTTFTIVGGGSIHDTTDAGMCGGQGGFYAKKIFTFGTAQSGAGADYFAAAPSAGQTLFIKVGAGGVGGAGTVTGGDGGPGKVRVTIA